MCGDVCCFVCHGDVYMLLAFFWFLPNLCDRRAADGSKANDHTK